MIRTVTTLGTDQARPIEPGAHMLLEMQGFKRSDSYKHLRRTGYYEFAKDGSCFQQLLCKTWARTTTRG